MDSPVRKLNPLLKLAAISGVETAIKLHIRRGDDLDARDSSGATPLILASARRRKGAVRLLLDAGANPTLADEKGMDALAHARKGGCTETISLLTEALARIAPPKPEHPEETRLGNPESFPGLHESVLVEDLDAPETPFEHRLDVESAGAVREQAVPITANEVDSPVSEDASEGDSEIVSLDEEPLDEFGADDWEAEEETVAPEGDESVAEAAKLIHETIDRHKVVDRDEDWGDVDLHLPARAAPLTRDEGAGAVRDLLLAALREGMVSEKELIEVCSNADGTRNEETERLLAVVAGELGATVVEWTGAEDLCRAEPSVEEERLLTEAMEFAEELASGRNDPFRFYAKDLRGELLEAEEEIALGREMEEAGRAALSALALWPDGLSALFEASDLVLRGEADAESFCAGPEPSTDDEPSSRTAGTDEEGEEGGFDDETFFVSSVASVKAALGDARRATEALKEARLTRGFLLELAGKADLKGSGCEFVEALERQAAARERMILSNLRLALSIAKRYLWSGIPFDDLVQEANIGLMIAVERYDWRRGFRFSTYATWWIRQQVSRSIADTGRVVRAPVHIQDTARKVLREREATEARLGRPEREVETARRVGASLAKTRMLLSMFDEAVSLDEIDPNTGLPQADGLPSTQPLDPVEVAEQASLGSTLLGMLDDLDERSREVILLRFGLAGEDAMTLEEVGQHFGVTRERIRQIESKTMRRLSHRNKREILWPFMGDGYAPSRAPSSEGREKPVESPSHRSDDESPQDDGQISLVPQIEHAAPAFPDSQPIRKVRTVERLIPVCGANEVAPRHSADPLPPSPVFPGDQVSGITDEVRALGLEVEDRHSKGAS